MESDNKIVITEEEWEIFLPLLTRHFKFKELQNRTRSAYKGPLKTLEMALGKISMAAYEAIGKHVLEFRQKLDKKKTIQFSLICASNPKIKGSLINELRSL